jgi:hypothetical protein
MKAQNTFIAVLLLLFQMQLVFAYPGENIARDANGDYVVTYWNGANLLQMTFSPATKIEPRVKSKLHLSSTNLIAYRYSISNGSKARQPITSVRIGNITRIYGSQTMPPTSSLTTPDAAIAAVKKMSMALVVPNRWEGVADVDPLNNSAMQADWFFFVSDHPNDSGIGVMPGGEVSGFGYSSFDLPGVIEMRMEGEVEKQGAYADEGPDPAESSIVQQLDQIEKNDYITRYVATPQIAIPLPFDAAILLDRIRAEMQTWPDKQLLNAAYSVKLDGYLSSAANAFRMNQPKAAREQVEAVRKLLAKEHHYVDHDDEDDEDTEEHKQASRRSIDRLAARVLDFDLRYVLKRTESGREHGEHDGNKNRNDQPFDARRDGREQKTR